jgi:hypothetical protein
MNQTKTIILELRVDCDVPDRYLNPDPDGDSVFDADIATLRSEIHNLAVAVLGAYGPRCSVGVQTLPPLKVATPGSVQRSEDCG